MCLDEAVALFGNTISGELEGIEAKTAKQREVKQTNFLRQRLGLSKMYKSPVKGTTPSR